MIINIKMVLHITYHFFIYGGVGYVIHLGCNGGISTLINSYALFISFLCQYIKSDIHLGLINNICCILIIGIPAGSEWTAGVHQWWMVYE